MVEEGDEGYGFVGSGGAVEVVFKGVGVVIDRISERGVGVSEVLLEGFWEQVAAFLGENTEKLFERFERLSEFEVVEFVSGFSQVVEVEGEVTQQGRIVVGIVPRPAAQVQEVILVHKLQPVQVKS